MITLPVSSEFELVGVADRGIPNKERVLIKATDVVQVQGLILCAGWSMGNGGTIIPIHGFTYFFPAQIVTPGAWIVVYTGKGQNISSKIPTTDELAYTFHWGHEGVIFDDDDIQPFVIRFTEIRRQMADTALLPKAQTRALPPS